MTPTKPPGAALLPRSPTGRRQQSPIARSRVCFRAVLSPELARRGKHKETSPPLQRAHEVCSASIRSQAYLLGKKALCSRHKFNQNSAGQSWACFPRSSRCGLWSAKRPSPHTSWQRSIHGIPGPPHPASWPETGSHQGPPVALPTAPRKQAVRDSPQVEGPELKRNARCFGAHSADRIGRRPPHSYTRK